MNESVPVSRARSSLWSSPHRPLTAGLALTVTLVAFESLAIATVMPLVAADLGGVALYGWVFSAFFLGNMVGIVAAGELADAGGLERPYLLGLALFALGLLAGGLAPSMPVLVVARAVQGIGAGAIPAVAYVSIGRQYAPALRPRMFAIMSTAWVVPGIAGPELAGLIAELLSWRAVLLALLPLVAVAAAITTGPLRRVDPNGSPATSASPRRPGPTPDAAGPSPGPWAGFRRSRLVDVLRVAIGAGLVLGGLDTRDLPLLVVLGVTGAVVGLPALGRVLPVGTLHAATGLPATTLLRGVLMFGFTGAEAFVPLMLVSVRGLSAPVAGISLTAATVAWAVGSWVQARRVAAVGTAFLIRLGLALVVLGIALVGAATWTAVPVLVGIAGWGVSGLGMGLGYACITLLVLHLAPAGREGVATAGLQLSDVLGTALGAGVGGIVLAEAPALGWDRAGALLATFVLAAVAVVGGIALSARLGPGSRAGQAGAAGHAQWRDGPPEVGHGHSREEAARG